MFKDLIYIFIQKKPIKQMVAEKPTFTKAIIAFVVIYLIIQIISAIENILISIVNAFVQALLAGSISAAITMIIIQMIITLPAYAILIPAGLIISFVSLLIIGGVNLITARLLGWKGKDYVQYINNLLFLDAAVALGAGIIIIVISLLGLIPIVGQIISTLLLIPVSLIVSVYFLYLLYKLIKSYFGLSTGKTIITLLMPMILLAIIGIVIFVILLILILVFGIILLPFSIA